MPPDVTDGRSPLRRHRRGHVGHPRGDQAPRGGLPRRRRLREGRPPRRDLAREHVPRALLRRPVALLQLLLRAQSGVEPSLRAGRGDPGLLRGRRAALRRGLAASGTARRSLRCAFERGRWRLETSDGATDEADVVIAATGVLHHPTYPDIDGLDTFAGPCFHSARWNHDVRDRRQARRRHRDGIERDPDRDGASSTRWPSSALFQRTAAVDRAGAEPRLHRRGEGDVPARRRRPSRRSATRCRAPSSTASPTCWSTPTSPMLQAIHDGVRRASREQRAGSRAAGEAAPDYRAACKRLIVSDGFYEAIQRPNATLVTEGIERIEPAGVRTRDGRPARARRARARDRVPRRLASCGR